MSPGPIDAMHQVPASDAEFAGEIQKIREALEAVAVADPSVCWLYLGEDGQWWVRREGDPQERCFPTRALAWTAIQLAVVRCTSYCLYLQDLDGRIVRRQANWLKRPDGR